MSKVLSVGVDGALVRHSPQGHLLFVQGSTETPETIWDVRKGEVATTLKGESGSIQATVFSADGKYLATAVGASCSVWDIKSGERLSLVKGEEGHYLMNAAAFSPVGKLLASGDWKDDNSTM